MRTSLALFSVTLAMGTAVEASPLNFAALLGRNNDKAASGDDRSASRNDECVQVKSRDGLCVSPADDRATEGGQVTLVDCDRASSWRVADGSISLCDESGLALSAGRDVRDGSRLELAREGSEFRVNDDGTISLGDQCLDTGRDNSLQTWTCDASNEAQQFQASPVEQRDDDKGEDDKKEDDKKDDVRTENTRPAATATATATVTEYKTRTDHSVETKIANHTQFLTKTEEKIQTKTQENEKVVTQTETFLQDVIKPTTKTEVKTQFVTETPKPVTETEVETATKNVTVTSTPKPVTETVKVTETPRPVTETRTETKVETQKPVTKYETKYETKYKTKTVEKEAQPTKDAGREEQGKEEHRDDGKDQGQDQHRDYSGKQGHEGERH